MENIEFKVGNVVKRISSEQKMTVHKIANNKIWCDYFDKENQLHRNSYDRNELIHVKN